MKPTYVKIKVTCDLEDEIKSCSFTVRMMPWLLEQGYPRKIIRLPKGVDQKSTPERIAKAVGRDYDEKAYSPAVKIIERGWRYTDGGFKRLSQARGVKLHASYEIKLTKYGTGGSFNAKKRTVTLLIDRQNPQDLLCTLVHEIMHIGIQHLIERYKVAHWRKERLVDLMVAKNFPKYKRLQKVKEDAHVVDEAFKKFYPDVSKIAKEIGA